MLTKLYMNSLDPKRSTCGLSPGRLFEKGTSNCRFFQEMSSRMDANDVLCVDVGDVTLWASLSASLTKGQRRGF